VFHQFNAAAQEAAATWRAKVQSVALDDVLNVRSSNSASSEILFTLGPNEESISVLSCTHPGAIVSIDGWAAQSSSPDRVRGIWCRIEHNDQTGWVNSYFLVATEREAQSVLIEGADVDTSVEDNTSSADLSAVAATEIGSEIEPAEIENKKPAALDLTKKYDFDRVFATRNDPPDEWWVIDDYILFGVQRGTKSLEYASSLMELVRETEPQNYSWAEHQSLKFEIDKATRYINRFPRFSI
jgi:hypothetical protein